MRRDELLLFRNFEDLGTTKGGPSIFDLMAAVMDDTQDDDLDTSEARELLYEALHLLLETAGKNGFYGNLWHAYLTNLLVNNENSYSCACEIRGDVEGTLSDAALHDIGIFQEYFNYDFSLLAEKYGVPEIALIENYKASPESGSVYNKRIRDRICELAQNLEAAQDAENMKAQLAAFYKEYGVGKIGLHKAFRIVRNELDEVEIVPINKILHVYLKDLVGYERAKEKLVANTEAFVAGRPANNCLLYGEAGTGKSSSIKAIANEYYDRGLRIIECYRHQFKDLHAVIDQIKDRNYRFIIYMDDLSFEEFETEYKYLKAVIEGGLEKKPSNVLIYATSNRRHLVRESFGDRAGVDLSDKHGGDTVQEKLSLSGRFGVSIYYGAPTFQEYHEIVKELAERHGITMDAKELEQEATRWEMNHGGLSGRTAQQFIDHLLGSMTDQ